MQVLVFQPERDVRPITNPLLLPYAGERCKYCDRTFNTEADMREHRMTGAAGKGVVFDGPAVACKACFEANREQEEAEHEMFLERPDR